MDIGASSEVSLRSGRIGTLEALESLDVDRKKMGWTILGDGSWLLASLWFTTLVVVNAMRISLILAFRQWSVFWLQNFSSSQGLGNHYSQVYELDRIRKSLNPHIQLLYTNNVYI